MTLLIEINCDNAALNTAPTGDQTTTKQINVRELGRLIGEMVHDLRLGVNGGTFMDANGNKVGQWNATND